MESVETEEERIEASLQEIRGWRTLLAIAMFAWIPFAVIAALLFGIHTFMYMGVCYFIILQIVNFRLNLLRCPKCGERFQSLFWGLWVHKCQNCGLPITKG